MNKNIMIPLSKKGKNAGLYETIVSSKDEDLTEWNWSVYKNVRNSYAIKVKRTKEGFVTSYMHRIILERKLGRELGSGEQVDHTNGDGLDNRRENLRLATNAENARNRSAQENNTSGYKGVSFDKKRKKWVAQLWFNNKKVLFSRHNTPEEAHEAYKKAACKYHNAFSNFGD